MSPSSRSPFRSAFLNVDLNQIRQEGARLAAQKAQLLAGAPVAVEAEAALTPARVSSVPLNAGGKGPAPSPSPSPETAQPPRRPLTP